MNNLIIRPFRRTIFNLYRGKLIFISLVFLASVIFGFIVQSYDKPLPFEASGIVWWKYLFQNLKQSVIVILIGTATYGIGNIILLALNGMVVGVGLELTIQNGRADTIITAFLPHAMFEIPAILLACICPYIIWGIIKESIRQRRIQTHLIKSQLMPVLLAIIVFLVVAAVLEDVFSL